MRRDIQDKFVALEIAPQGDARFTGEVWSARFGHLLAAEMSAVPQSFPRTAKLVSRATEECFQVGLVARGFAHVVQDGQECRLAEGDFVVHEAGRPLFWKLDGDWKLLVFTWPREAIALDHAQPQRVTARVFRGSTGLNRIIANVLTALAMTRPNVQTSNVARLAEQVGTLVVTAALEQCVDEAPEPEQPSDLFRAVQEYIEDNLDDPHLDPESIARAFFISTRTLHRLFARQGQTVSRWIRTRRLEKARRKLTSREARDRSITEIMIDCGFSDLALFSRAFRAEYGLSPREYRARHAFTA
ncbi:hypothetical protein TH66_01670 [Carbonactinospora thermoautotrophica]|uniref:HTH araC/xylS-type domain-containing protein n=2 Tax=Carbonactinospora thermoautotrophica TaxID=1469144 RepID=A0A132N6L9_9ACTN|nr:helix-turn-helix domain-containing protein [Carbonactinospora thermoautotrophica]KWX05758.1 hypothetical protein TH66_01670 [Carbonactinospora thermoautotrophica]KWX07714.1 hypothetical protein TR74_17825 [Carbonactinospora thermoautotrophica]